MPARPDAAASGRPGSAPVRPDAVRRHNLARLLGEVHRHGELSRADLTARLDLNRSTIGTLVGELVAGGLLDDAAPDLTARPLSAGRPSHLVRPRADGPFVLAVDIELDRATVAAVGVGGAVHRRVDVDLDTASPEATAAAVAQVLRRTARAVDGFPVGVGVSVPGSVSRHGDVVVRAPNLGWHDVDLVALLRDRLRPASLRDLPVRVGNDANLGAVAEQVRGNAREAADLVFLLGRIGVGAGIIAGSRLLTGHEGAAGEVGHLCLVVDGPWCHCGSRGCAEIYIGDAALLTAAGRPGEPRRETVEAILAGAAAGCAAELAAVREVARHLGRTVAALLNVVNPAVVVTGGTLARVVEIAGDVARTEVGRFAFGQAGAAARLSATTVLARDSCLLGAAELAFESLLADPATYAATA